MKRFHGGCCGCTRQELEQSFISCLRCKYFTNNWDDLDLNNKPEPTEEEIKYQRKREVEYILRMEEEKRREEELIDGIKRGDITYKEFANENP